MLSVLDIILISLGGVAVIIYATLKIIQVVKFRKLVQLGLDHGLEELDARKQAYEQVYHKSKESTKVDEVNKNDDIIEE